MTKIKCVPTITIMILFLIDGYGYAGENYEKCSKLKSRIDSTYSECKDKCGGTADMLVGGLKDFNEKLGCRNGCLAKYPYLGATPQQSAQNMAFRNNCEQECEERGSRNLDAVNSKREACNDGCEQKKESALENLADMCD